MFEQRDQFAPVKSLTALKSKFREMSKRYGPDKPEYDEALFTEIKAQYDAYTAHFKDGAALPDFSLTAEQRAEAARNALWSEAIAQDNRTQVAAAMSKRPKADALKTVAARQSSDYLAPQLPNMVLYPYRVFLGAKFYLAHIPDLLTGYDFDELEIPISEPLAYLPDEPTDLTTPFAASKNPTAALMILSLLPHLDALRLSYSLSRLTLWIEPVSSQLDGALEKLGLKYADKRGQWYYPAEKYAAQQKQVWQPTPADLAILGANFAALALPAPAPAAEPVVEPAVTPEPEPASAAAPAKKERKPRVKKDKPEPVAAEPVPAPEPEPVAAKPKARKSRKSAAAPQAAV